MDRTTVSGTVDLGSIPSEPINCFVVSVLCYLLWSVSDTVRLIICIMGLEI